MKRTAKIFVNLFVLIAFAFVPIQPGQVQAEPLLQVSANSISGRITDGSGDGVANAIILAVSDPLYVYLPNIVRSGTSGGTLISNQPESGQNYYTVEVDSNGYYTLDDLPSGRYVISARKEGKDFLPLSYEVTTTSGGSSYDFQEVIIPTIYTPGTITLSEATLAELISISEDGMTLTFASETDDLAQLHPGDVLIGGITTLTPEGFLRKAISISANGIQRVIVTEPATLEDGFESLSVQTTQQLSSDQVKNLTSIPGVTLSQKPALMGLGDFQFTLNNAVIYDNDGNLSTTGDQIVTNGVLSVSPNIEFRIRIENGSLEEFYYTSTMSVDTGFTISSKISLNVTLAETNLAPTITLGAIPVGPLVLTPTLDIVAGVTGSVYAGVSTSIKNTTTFTAGLWHIDNQTRDLSNFSSSFSASPLSFNYGLSFKAFLGPKVSVKIYGVVGGYVKPGVALTLTIAPASDPWLTLKGGLEVSVGVSVTVPIIGTNLLNIQLGAINHWILLYSLSTSSTNPPNLPDNPFPPEGSMNQSLNTHLSWTGGDPDGDTVLYDVYFDMGFVVPLTKVADHQSAVSFDPGTLSGNTIYSWRVRAFDQHGVYSTGPVWRFTTGDGSVIPGEMVTIPAGNFEMGCDTAHNGGYPCPETEVPLHTVYLDTYRIDKYEVTNAQYAQCVANGGCNAPAYNFSNTRTSYYDDPSYANYPVIYVSWYDATNYCYWAGKRLPTEAEWEKAARGLTVSAYPWGDNNPTCSLVNGYIGSLCVGDTSAVGSYPEGASPYGVMDMAGNVWELVGDWFQNDYYSFSSPSNPQGPTSGSLKVARGASWEESESLRVAYRGSVDPSYPDHRQGFRCAAPAP